MNTRRLLPLALVALSASALPAQSFWNSQLRFGPQFHSYRIKSPLNETVAQWAMPLFVSVPVLPALTLDVGSSFAMVAHEGETRDASGNVVTTRSELSGLTDTQLRANYTFGADFVVLTAGLNLPTGSATLDPSELAAATRIGSDFFSFPISGFGSGFGVTGGVAVARPLGDWNWGLGASVRQASEYEPFRDASGTATRFTPGPEYRARFGLDHPLGVGRIAVGFTYSKFGDDKANAITYNTGDRYIVQASVSNALQNGVDYSVVVWNLYRTSGSLIDGSSLPWGNIANAMLLFGVRGPADVLVEPSVETRLWMQEGSTTSFLGSMGLRLVANRGRWAVVPGFGFSFGIMESATVTGLKGTLAVRLGG